MRISHLIWRIPNAAARGAAGKTLLEENDRGPAGKNMPRVPGFAILIAAARAQATPVGPVINRIAHQPISSDRSPRRAAIDQQCRSSVRSWNLAPAAPSPGSAAAAATPAATAPAATHAATTTTAATMAPAVRDLHFAADFFLIEEMERSETDVGHFFLAERDCLVRREVRRLRHVRCRYARC
jgi:hypothetical protein